MTPVRKLRDTIGKEIEIAIEFHAQWNVTSAIRIAHALEPYPPMWLEDMLMLGNFKQYHEVAAATSLPLIAGERMGGNGIRGSVRIPHHQIRDVRHHLAWRHDRGAQDRRHGGRL